MTPIQTTTQVAAAGGDHRSGAPRSPGEPVDYVAVAVVAACLLVGVVILNATSKARAGR